MFDDLICNGGNIPSVQDMSYRLQMENDKRSAIVLGYRVTFTEAEYMMLGLLLRSGEAVSGMMFGIGCGIVFSSVPVHVANINKKVLPITGRRLVENDGSGGYRISNTM